MLRFDVRDGPSANVVLVGEVLGDSGSGTVPAVARTRAFLGEARPRWLVLTHFHADHAGGAGVLGLPVAAHKSEAELVNARDPRACDGEWLGFGIGPYRVDRALERMIASVERIAALERRLAIPGHGPPVTDVPAAVERTLARYERFRADPERGVWHAVRRAVVSHAMTAPQTAAAATRPRCRTSRAVRSSRARHARACGPACT
jgi:glyoxylase-like metal-dependent hydrolase (beta-lactamase superfamily II)